MEKLIIIQVLIVTLQYVTSQMSPPNASIPNSMLNGSLVPDCAVRGCPANSVCRKQTYVTEGPEMGCFSDIHAEISDRLDVWNRYWNMKNWKGLEEFYAPDSLFLPPGGPIRRGPDGFAEFIAGRVAANNWNIGTWTIDEFTALSEDLVATVEVLEISSSEGGKVKMGKDIILWRKTNGVYLILYEAFNFDG